MPTTRTLTNTGAPLHSPEGELLGGVQIHFQLMDMGGRPSDAWDAISNERVGGETVIVTTDAAGEFSVDLWPNTRGNRETKYKCRVQFEGFREFSGVIEDVPGDLQWAAFMLAGSSMEPQDMSAVAAAITSHINSADPHPQYAKESDLGNAAGLDVGTTAGTVAAGDDARLSDPRTPTGGAGGVLSGSYPNPGFAVDMATQGELDAVAAALTAHVGTGGASHANAIASGAAGFMTGADKSKLDGIAAGATANATDAQLRDRATHTGSQAISTVAGLQGALDAVNAAKLDKTARGAANGVASLDASGKVPASELPAIAITDVFTVASQAAMLALTAERGDLAVRSDLNKSFALAAEPASTLANWVELRTPTDAVLSVAGKTGAVTLAKADVGLSNADNTSDANKPVSTATQAALNSKEGAIASGTTAQFWCGDKTWRDFFTDVRAATLTGLSTATSAAVSAADTVLAAIGKLQAQVSARVSKSGDTMTGVLTLVNQTLPLTTNNLPTICPTLLLDFANSRYVDPRITFTRASTATRVNERGLIETVAANVPRIDFDPVTLACKGLLIEEARTNALLNSLIDGTPLTTQSVTVTAATRTLSFYGTGQVVLSGAHSATLTGTGAFPNITVLTFTPAAGTLTLTVTGDVKFAQLEVGTFPTSFTPTADAAVTRAADVASMTGANFSSWYRQDEGTFVIEGDTSYTASNFPVFSSVSDGTGNNIIYLNSRGSTTTTRMEASVGGVVQVVAIIQPQQYCRVCRLRQAERTS